MTLKDWKKISIGKSWNRVGGVWFNRKTDEQIEVHNK